MFVLTCVAKTESVHLTVESFLVTIILLHIERLLPSTFNLGTSVNICSTELIVEAHGVRHSHR